MAMGIIINWSLSEPNEMCEALNECFIEYCRASH